jgi:hypothetical protein
MKVAEIQQAFERIGARVKVTASPDDASNPIRLNVRRDECGEFFDLRPSVDAQPRILDYSPRDSHLLLVANSGGRWGREQLDTFLCGFDERSWFVAAVPEQAEAITIQAAKDALKPQEVWDAMRKHGVPHNQRDLRRTSAFVRQGEWFFIPGKHQEVEERNVLRNEPIRRGGGKPHVCEFLYRDGGEMVHVSAAHPNGLTHDRYLALPRLERLSQRWVTMARNARVYVRGSVSHRDHETIQLDSWHCVVMNTEIKARAMRHVAFLD